MKRQTKTAILITFLLLSLGEPLSATPVPPKTIPTKIAILAASPTLAPLVRQIEAELSKNSSFSIRSYSHPLSSAEITDEALARAQSLFVKGQGAFYHLLLEDAIQNLNLSIAQFKKGMPFLKEGEELYEAHVILAKAYLAKEMTGKAEEQMRSAARLFPGHKLSPNRHAPDFSAHFKKVVDEIQKLSRYRVELSSNPGQAIVYVNGFYRGTTPLTVEELTEGKHTVRIEKEGFEPMVEELLVGGKESKKSHQWTLNRDLAPHFARLASLSATASPPEEWKKSDLLARELKFLSQALNTEHVICLLEGGDRITAAIGTQNALHTIDLSPQKKSPRSPASLLEEILMNDQSTSDRGGDHSANLNPQQTLFPLRSTVMGNPSDGEKGEISTAVPWWVWTVAAGLLIGSATFYGWNRGETAQAPSGEAKGPQKPSPGSAEIANRPAVTLSFP